MKRLLDYLEKFLEFIATICLAIFSATTFLQVVLRMFNIPIIWAEEVARFTFIYMVFLGSAVGVRRSTHYFFDVFEKISNQFVIFAAKLTALLLELLFMIFLLYTSILFVPQMAARASSILRIPVSVPYSSIIVFSGIGMVFVVEKLVEFLKKGTALEVKSNSSGTGT